MDAVTHENVVRLVHERVIQGFDFPCTVLENFRRVVRVAPAFALVIEWCEYGTVLDLLLHARVQNLLPAAQLEAMALSYFRQIVNAVEALHTAGLYHLDIKAENVFLTCKPAPVAVAAQAAAAGAAVEPAVPVEPRHLIKLADFGTARRIDVRDGVDSIR
jgi:serine/threonine protein kinase